MLEYYKKKEMKKIEMEVLKEEKKRLRETKKKLLEEQLLIRKRKRLEKDDSSESDSEGHMSCQESDISEIEERSEGEEEALPVTSIKDLKEGDFILVEFKGGKRMVSVFVYLCVIQKIISINELEVMGLKSTDRTKKSFVVKENDISNIKFKQILGKLKNPNIVAIGERVSYQFLHSLPIKEI